MHLSSQNDDIEGPQYVHDKQQNFYANFIFFTKYSICSSTCSDIFLEVQYRIPNMWYRSHCSEIIVQINRIVAQNHDILRQFFFLYIKKWDRYFHGSINTSAEVFWQTIIKIGRQPVDMKFHRLTTVQIDVNTFLPLKIWHQSVDMKYHKPTSVKIVVNTFVNRRQSVGVNFKSC